MSTVAHEAVKDTATDGTPAGSDTETAALTTDDLHHLLSNSRRRTVVAVLDDEHPLPKDTLAERVAARETGKGVDELDYQERKRTLVSLHQCHLPKLVDHGVIERHHEGYVPGPAAAELLPYLDGVDVDTGSCWFSKALGKLIR